MFKNFLKLSKTKADGRSKTESLIPNTPKKENPARIKAPLNKVEMWDKIGRICVYFLFGLVPVFFLPFTSFPVIENKSALGGLLVFIAFGAWLVKVLNVGKISLPKTKIWLFVALFIVIAAISTILSDSSRTSLWGYLSASDSFSHFVIYSLAFFLVPLFLRETGHLIRALLFFSVSLLLLSVFSLLQILGIFILPFDFSKNIAFNPIGNPQALAIFLGSGLVMLMALVASFRLSLVMKAVFSVAALLLGAVLLLVNFSYTWLGLFFCSVLVVSWQVMNSRRQSGGYTASSDASDRRDTPDPSPLKPKFGLPVALMIVVAILFFVKPPISSIVQMPAEVRPSFSATMQIAAESVKSDVSSALFGSGPSTFLYEFLKHRPQELNATVFWETRFSQGFSSISTMLLTLGILGTASLLLLMGAFGIAAFKGITLLSASKNLPSAKRSVSSSEKIALISFVSFLFLALFWFIYPINFPIYLFTFLFMGVVISALISGGAMKTIEFSFVKTPQYTFIASAVVIVMVVSVIVGGYWHVQKYAASVFYGIAVSQYNEDGNVDGALEKIQTALNLDSTRDVYWRTFSELLNLKAREIASAGNLSSPDAQRRYQVALQNLIQSAQRVTAINPLDPLNWRQLAAVYESNIAIVRGSEVFAIKNYQEALNRNPSNPRDYLNLARAYVLAADGIQRGTVDLKEGKTPAEQKKEYLGQARDSLQRAITLKSDFSAAHFMISQVYERLGERALAIQKNMDARSLNPQDTGIGYQLGLLYYLDGQYSKAISELERVVGLNVNFSNARYFLGLSYEKTGDLKSAIENFVKIEELNPENQEVKRILANLRAGRSALAEISPPAPAPEDRLEAPIEGGIENGMDQESSGDL